MPAHQLYKKHYPSFSSSTLAVDKFNAPPIAFLPKRILCGLLAPQPFPYQKIAHEKVAVSHKKHRQQIARLTAQNLGYYLFLYHE